MPKWTVEGPRSFPERLLPRALRDLAQQFAAAPTVTSTPGTSSPERLKLASDLFNLTYADALPGITVLVIAIAMVPPMPKVAPPNTPMLQVRPMNARRNAATRRSHRTAIA